MVTIAGSHCCTASVSLTVMCGCTCCTIYRQPLWQLIERWFIVPVSSWVKFFLWLLFNFLFHGCQHCTVHPTAVSFPILLPHCSCYVWSSLAFTVLQSYPRVLFRLLYCKYLDFCIVSITWCCMATQTFFYTREYPLLRVKVPFWRLLWLLRMNFSFFFFFFTVAQPYLQVLFSRLLYCSYNTWFFMATESSFLHTRMPVAPCERTFLKTPVRG